MAQERLPGPLNLSHVEREELKARSCGLPEILSLLMPHELPEAEVKRGQGIRNLCTSDREMSVEVWEYTAS